MIEALGSLSGRTVSRETFDRLAAYVNLLRSEAGRQNLIAPSTVTTVWKRHVLDSAQLARFETREGCRWVDIGSGAGLPGMVLAIILSDPITLIEPRRLRAEFLQQAVRDLGLTDRVTVECDKVERARGTFDVITARAVASLDALLRMSHHLSTSETTWILPKGRNAQSELAQAKLNWHCEARVEQSCTDPDSEIIVLTKVGARKRR
jgi:16S rRNA (guanine527-N7)-methyltransferase